MKWKFVEHCYKTNTTLIDIPLKYKLHSNEFIVNVNNNDKLHQFAMYIPACHKKIIFKNNVWF